MLVALFFATFITATEIINPGSFGAPGWGSLMVSQMFFGGLTLFLVGAVLEYVAVLVLRAQGKPVFFVIDRSQDARIASLLAGESE
jgi:hypothetical protein